MPANMRRIMSEVPRGLEIVDRDARNDTADRPGRKRITEREVTRRVEPLLALVASGEIPVDNHIAQALKTYVEHHRHAIEQ